MASYLQHDGAALSERGPASFQVAVLYTARNGERRVRVLNLQVPVTTLVGNVFRYGDLDAVATLMFKEGELQKKTKKHECSLCDLGRGTVIFFVLSADNRLDHSW